MRPSLLVTLLLATGNLVAQHCIGPAPAAELRTCDPFLAEFFLPDPCQNQPNCPLPPSYTGFALFFDLAVAAPCTLTGMATLLYDEGSIAANPDQTGNRSVVRVYTCATTRVGNENLAPGTAGSPWTLAGSGVLTVARPLATSPIVFPTPIALGAGAFGVAIEVTPTDTVFHPGNVNVGALHPIVGTQPPVLRSDQFFSLTAQGSQSLAFQSTVSDWFAGNVAISYQPGPNNAYSANYAPGCYDSPWAFHETFDGDFDLASTSQHWTFTGRNYDLAAGSATFVTPIGTPLTASPPATPPWATSWAESLSAPITLPAPFRFPGGPVGGTTQITVGSEGRIFLGPVTDPVAAWSFAELRRFVELPASLAPCFGNFDASAGGAIYYETDHATWARVTWLDVPEWLQTAPNSFQVTLHLATGDLDVVYGNVGAGVHSRLVGFTPGNTSPLGPELDLSAILPWSSGVGITAPRLVASARPVLGTTVNLITSDLVAGTANVLTSLSLGTTPGGLSLAPFGMPGCTLHLASLDWLYVLGVGAAGTATVPLSVPNHPLVIGLPLHAQSAAMTPGYNAAGILLSNGLCLALH